MGARGLLAVLVLVSASVSLTGCFKKWEMSEVEGWYEEKPKDFDDYMRLAREKTAAGETAKAMKLYADGMNDLQAQFPDDVRIATCAEELGVLQEKLGMYQQAEESFRRALQVREKNLPPTHLDVKRSKQKLADVLKKLGRAEEAQQVLSGKKDSGSSSDKKSEVRVRRHKRP
jgi:tetratricopeptide (TPR) repeat protein